MGLFPTGAHTRLITGSLGPSASRPPPTTVLRRPDVPARALPASPEGFFEGLPLLRIGPLGISRPWNLGAHVRLSEVLPAPLLMHLLYTYPPLDPTCHLRSAPRTSAWRSLLQKSLAQLCLALLVKQRSLLGSRVAVATIAESLYPFELVTPGDLPHPLLGVAHHHSHFPDRISQRHPPSHKQVGAQHRIGSLAVEAF